MRSGPGRRCALTALAVLAVAATACSSSTPRGARRPRRPTRDARLPSRCRPRPRSPRRSPNWRRASNTCTRGRPSRSTSDRRGRWPPRSSQGRRPTSSRRPRRRTWPPCRRPTWCTGTPVTFARNRLEIVVKPGNPLGIHSLADLTKASVVSICVPTAPCGSTAQEALTKAGVTLATSKVSLGPTWMPRWPR